MSNTVLNLGRLRVTLPIFSKLIVASLLLEVFSGITTTVKAQSTNQTNTQPNTQQEAEARQYMGVLIRAQKAFYLENKKFASTIPELKIGSPKEPKNYGYVIFPSKDPTQSVVMAAKGYDPEIKGYLSGVFLTNVNGEALTIAGTCETIKPGFLPGEPMAPQSGSKFIVCPAGYQLLKPSRLVDAG